MKNYWSSLDDRGRRGVVVGAVLILVVSAGVAIWGLRERFVPVATDLVGERLASATHALDAAKIPYHVMPDGASIEVPEGQVGRARVELSGGSLGGVATQGFELFNNTDFAATDFSQRINYQRALQGELVRTIQSMEGIRAARVHLFLPESSLLKKQTQHPSAAVALSMVPGQALSPSQVRGIQRLVAAAIPDIKPEAITLVDFSGRPLSHASDTEADAGDGSRLESKRDADAYLENKVRLLLSEAFPGSDSSVSVDATLDMDRIKVTTDQTLPGKTPSDSEREVGVVTREKQTTRSLPSAGGQTQEAEVTDSEYEYQVGHRLEESLQTPGSIRRLSVAVVIRGAGASVAQADVERLVARAIGVQPTRGDEVAVLMLPAASLSVSAPTAAAPIDASPVGQAQGGDLARKQSKLVDTDVFRTIAWLSLAAVAGLALVLALRRNAKRTSAAMSDAELAELGRRIKEWMREGEGDARP
jgi:flagellar M-ring protein FliF